jgi:hypothetical protein
MRSSGKRLVLVPSAWHRAVGWWLVLCGVGALALTGRTGSVVLDVLVPVVGLLVLGIGLDIALTRLVVTPEGVQVRRLLAAKASTPEIRAVEARATSGLNSGKVRIEIERSGGRPIRLTRFQRWATPEGWTAANTDAAAIREVLGGVAPERPGF